MSNTDQLNPETIKNTLLTQLKQLQEKYVTLTLELRILEKQIYSKFPETRKAAASAVIEKRQEMESHEVAIQEVQRMISEL